MKAGRSDIPDAAYIESRPQTIKVSAATTDQKDAMARLFERFGVGH